MCILFGLLARPWYAAAEAYRRPPHGHPTPNASCKDLQDPVIIASCRATPTSSPCNYRRWHWPTTTSIFKQSNIDIDIHLNLFVLQGPRQKRPNRQYPGGIVCPCEVNVAVRLLNMLTSPSTLFLK